MARSYPRPKAGSTAIPFLITVLISLFVFGSVALYFYNLMTEKAADLSNMPASQSIISEDDINTVLFVLTPDDSDRYDAVMMLRFDPVMKEEYCLGIPLDLIVDHEGRSMTVAACLTNHGVAALKSALGKCLDQEIDRYIALNSRSFKVLIELTGNVSYTIPVKDEGIRPTSTSVELDAAQFETMLTSNRYTSEMSRYSAISMSCAQLLNQCDGKRIAANIDSYFSRVINAVSTDITQLDFQNHRHAIKYVFEYAHDSEHSPARGIDVVCSETPEGLLTPDPAFLEQLKVTFNQYNGDSKPD